MAAGGVGAVVVFAVVVVVGMGVARSSVSYVLSRSKAQCPRTTRRPTNCHSNVAFPLDRRAGVVDVFGVAFFSRLGLRKPCFCSSDLGFLAGDEKGASCLDLLELQVLRSSSSLSESR